MISTIVEDLRIRVDALERGDQGRDQKIDALRDSVVSLSESLDSMARSLAVLARERSLQEAV